MNKRTGGKAKGRGGVDQLCCGAIQSPDVLFISWRLEVTMRFSLRVRCDVDAGIKDGSKSIKP